MTTSEILKKNRKKLYVTLIYWNVSFSDMPKEIAIGRFHNVLEFILMLSNFKIIDNLKYYRGFKATPQPFFVKINWQCPPGHHVLYYRPRDAPQSGCRNLKQYGDVIPHSSLWQYPRVRDKFSDPVIISAIISANHLFLSKVFFSYTARRSLTRSGTWTCLVLEYCKNTEYPVGNRVISQRESTR